MKPGIPAANAVVATLYLLIIIAIGYVLKLVFKSHGPIKTAKYSESNLSKGLISPLMQSHISPSATILRSYLLKYSIVGTFRNKNKCYLLKQIFIIAIIGVCCCAINWIILWPLTLAFGFSLSFFILMEALRIPFAWNSSTKIEQQKKMASNEDQQNQIQIEPGLSLENNLQPSVTQPAKQQKVQIKTHSHKFIVCVSLISFTTLILITQTMLTIYNSISNLGALNLGSVACVAALDQFVLRPCLGGILLLSAKIVQQASTRSIVQDERAAQNSQNNLTLFSLTFFRNLCEDVLITRMNQLYDLHGESSNYEMGASPTRKKTLSPSRIPKAPLIGESETLMNINATKRAEEELEEQNIDNTKKDVEIEQSKESPIKQIGESMLKESGIFTTVQKQMFWQQLENDHNGSNRKVELQSAQKIKVNPNQYFSAQRLPKDDLCHEQPMQDDGLVLVEAGLNLIKQRQPKLKPNTIDIQFSPTKKRKKTMGAYPKRRQLIITGSSPYLQYLPDMMKKEKLLKKNLTPSSQQQIPTVSRKVL